MIRFLTHPTVMFITFTAHCVLAAWVIQKLEGVML